MKVADVRRNLVPDTCTADGEGALPKLGPCRHDNSCVGCRGTEMATSRLFCVECDDVVEVCWPTLIQSSVCCSIVCVFCCSCPVSDVDGEVTSAQSSAVQGTCRDEPAERCVIITRTRHGTGSLGHWVTKCDPVPCLTRTDTSARGVHNHLFPVAVRPWRSASQRKFYLTPVILVHFLVCCVILLKKNSLHL